MVTKKKIKDYFNKSVRKLKHRKGFGVHSPFAFAIITEVIEEKNPYYAYSAINRVYTNSSPISFKVASLMLRLANRFKARKILEIKCDGGYTALPLVLVDSRNEILSLADNFSAKAASMRLGAFGQRAKQVTYINSLDAVADDYKADMIILNEKPEGIDIAAFRSWLTSHMHENTAIFVKGVRPKQKLEELWDMLCDDDNIEITMDLYDYGLAIKRPRFFKQHYIVSF